MSELSRRKFLLGSAAVAAVSGLPQLALADTARKPAASGVEDGIARPDGLVHISANEYPEGPSALAIKSAQEVSLRGNRYGAADMDEFYKVLSAQLGVPADYIVGYPGSGPALHATTLAFTGPGKSLVTAEATFEAAWRTAAANGAKVLKLKPRADGAHDVEAMCAADPQAGLIYICNPNNPTGSLTPHKDVEYALAHKPAGAVVLVDEAYIHLSDNAVSAVDLVARGEDVVVLRTFSKLYGMAGMRLGYAVARPDLLEKIKFFGTHSLPVTAVAAGIASLTDPTLVPTRRAAIRKEREATIAWLEKQGYACTPSESNCFMVDVKRPAKEFMADMAAWGVLVGRSWQGYETWPRITVGTPAEMARFRESFAKVMAAQKGPMQPKTHGVARVEGGLIQFGGALVETA